MKELLDRVLRPAVAVILGIMVINVVWQVFSRYVLGSPSPITEELSRYMLIWLGLLGAAYAYSQGLHLALDLATHKLKNKGKARSELIIHFLILMFALSVMVVGGVRLVYITWVLNQISASLQIKLAYVYLVVPLSGLLISAYASLFLRDAVQLWKRSRIDNTL